MAKIKKQLSLDKQIVEVAKKKATAMFGGNISAYVNYLIYTDCVADPNFKKYLEEKEEEKKC